MSDTYINRKNIFTPNRRLQGQFYGQANQSGKGAVTVWSCFGRMGRSLDTSE
jgi:hypothetical protein